AGMLGRQFPKVETMLREAAADITAFADFPVAHWKKIWSTNPLVICSAAVSVFYVDHEGSEWSVLRSGCGYLQPSMKQILEGRCA
ncbi:transposase, partial [Mycolicibacterium goodii]|uniref:transposase n=1 Tax=Mycolicibacterium goodii TaxID=134601 RepID=UPI00256EF831